MAKNGGSAFPVMDHEKLMFHAEPGMSLRDWFAGQALSGRMARGSSYRTWEDASVDAYQMADAMLAEREKGNA